MNRATRAFHFLRLICQHLFLIMLVMFLVFGAYTFFVLRIALSMSLIDAFLICYVPLLVFLVEVFGIVFSVCD